MKQKTHFGFSWISPQEKSVRVQQVFSSVAANYDLMNDLMSLGIHRLWKKTLITLIQTRPGDRLADFASGSGDIALLIAQTFPHYGELIVSDSNPAMLRLAKKRFLNAGIIDRVRFVQENTEEPNLADKTINIACLSFGLRNMTNKAKALKSIYDKLVSGGQLLILEFSRPTHWSFLYNTYSFTVIPALGKLIAKDESSYRYLVESIRMHPSQDSLKQMMEEAGFINCHYHNLSMGIVAVHNGVKP